MEMEPLDLTPPDAASRFRNKRRDASAFRQMRVSAKLDSYLRHLGKPFIHFFLVGEQLLDARALLHALEMRGDVGEARDVHAQLGGAAAAPEEMRVGGGEMVEKVLSAGSKSSPIRKFSNRGLNRGSRHTHRRSIRGSR